MLCYRLIWRCTALPTVKYQHRWNWCTERYTWLCCVQATRILILLFTTWVCFVHLFMLLLTSTAVAGVRVFASACLFFRMISQKPMQLGSPNFHDELWKPMYFGVKVTNHQNIADTVSLTHVTALWLVGMIFDGEACSCFWSLLVLSSSVCF